MRIFFALWVSIAVCFISQPEIVKQCYPVPLSTLSFPRHGPDILSRPSSPTSGSDVLCSECVLASECKCGAGALPGALSVASAEHLSSSSLWFPGLHSEECDGGLLTLHFHQRSPPLLHFHFNNTTVRRKARSATGEGMKRAELPPELQLQGSSLPLSSSRLPSRGLRCTKSAPFTGSSQEICDLRLS